MIVLIAGVLLIIGIIFLIRVIKKEEEAAKRLNKVDNFEELYNTIDRNIILTDRQNVLVTKVNKLKEKQDSVKSKLDDQDG